MLALIKPPTDNLYKFLAIFGLVLFVVGFVFPPWLFYQSSLQLLKTVAGNEELKAYEKFAWERQQQLEARKKQAESELRELQARLSNLTSSRRSGSGEVDKLESAIRDAYKRLETLEDASYEFKLNLELKRAQVKEQHTFSTNETRNSRLVMVVGWLVAALGLLIAFVGFVMWYSRLQVIQDQILKKQSTSTDAASATTPEAEASEPDAAQTETPQSESSHTEADETSDRARLI